MASKYVQVYTDLKNRIESQALETGRRFRPREN